MSSKLPPPEKPGQPSAWRERAEAAEGHEPLSAREQAAEVAKAVTAELLPKLEEAMQKRLDEFLAKLKDGREAQQAPAGGVLGGLFGSPRGASSGASADKLAKVSSSLDTLMPQLDRLIKTVDDADKSRSQLSGGGMPKEQFFEKKFDGMEKRIARKVDESLAATVAKFEQLESDLTASTAEGGGDVDQWNVRALSLVNEEVGAETDEIEGFGSTGRTFVVNVRRLQTLLDFSQLYTRLVQGSALVGLVIIALSGQSGDYGEHYRYLLADAIFLVGGTVLYFVHTVQHGSLKTSSISTLGLGDHSGSGGQSILDSAIPGVNNPDACIQALSLMSPSRYWGAYAMELLLRFACLALWILIVLAWREEILPQWQGSYLVHISALNGVATLYMLTHFIFGKVVDRELNSVMPWKSNGEPWDMARDGVPGQLGWLLGPPCVWFGCPEAYDDLRIWMVMSSNREKNWAISQKAPLISPVEMGIYALRGSSSGARLAQSLRGSKLFDSHRQVFVKRASAEEEKEGKRPSVVVTGLAKHSGSRGNLHDVDLRRELPEALNINLVLYDQRTTMSWALARTGQDPSSWITVKRWQSQESLHPEIGYINSEVPVWDATLMSCCTNTTDIFCGTFGGFRTMVHIARGQASFIDANTGASDVRADVMALKKLGNHPNLLILYTSGTTPEGRPYMALESYESIGCLLPQLVNQYWWEKSVLPPWMTMQLFQGLGDGLAHLHSQDIIHRCLRAEGVVVTMEHQAKLADLGMVAKCGTRDELKASHVAPEVCQGGVPQGPPVDFWGLGVVLHEIYQGRSDLVDFHVYPPRPRPDSPSSSKGMDFTVQSAMVGLLDFDPKRRWNLDTMLSSAWFARAEVGDVPMRPVVPELERRTYLRRYLGHVPPPGACVADVVVEDKGIVGKTLAELAFNNANAQVLLVTRKGGRYCAPQPLTKVEVGDSISFGLMPDYPMADLLGRLGSRFTSLASAEPPLVGFDKVAPAEVYSKTEETDRQDSARGEYAVGRLTTFNAEFDCFLIPHHTVGHEIYVSTLKRLNIPIAGVLRAGHWSPEWFPDDTIPVRQGDLGLVFRAPKRDGSSVPVLKDEELEVLMNEKDLEARLAVHKGLEDAY